MNHDNWISHNLLDRKQTPELDFKVNVVQESFEEMSFHDASIYTASLISNLSDNLYIGLSGGLDSEYVATLFHSLGIPFTPIIALCEGNELERQYAFRTCKLLGVEPITVRYYNRDIVHGMLKINNQFNGRATNAVTTFLLSEYVNQNNGILITGDHFIDDDNPLSTVMCCEWDFYASAFNPKNIEFFLYTRELCYSMIKSVNITDTQEFKSSLYNLLWRPKMSYIYNTAVNEIFKKMKRYDFLMSQSYNRLDFLRMIKND